MQEELEEDEYEERFCFTFLNYVFSSDIYISNDIKFYEVHCILRYLEFTKIE